MRVSIFEDSCVYSRKSVLFCPRRSEVHLRLKKIQLSLRNRIETGLPGDTEMKVWTATITKKSNSILAGNLSKGLNAKET